MNPTLSANLLKARLLKVAKRLKAEVDFNRLAPYVDFDVFAPRGKVWKCSGTHGIVGSQVAGEKPELVYEDAIQRMDMGVEDCGKSNCEVCEG